MITEPTRSELRQNWSKGHAWTFVLDRDKLVMNAMEKGNHFHNDIPLDQIDPYESEEKFFLLRWPIYLVRLGVILSLGCGYLFGIVSLWMRRPQWSFLIPALCGVPIAAFAIIYYWRHHRTLFRFYHRMTGVELFAVFKDLPDREDFEKFLATLKMEIPPWSSTFSGPSKTENMAGELKALHQLRKDNVLTDEEFLFKKRDLLAQYFHHGRETKD